jgi:antitoxin component of MazEF toxin-antitoxin module
MADPSLSHVLEQFTAIVQKGGFVAVPAAARKKLGLTKRQDNHLVRLSLRKAGGGRWNHDYARLTFDSEFAVPAKALGVKPGDEIEIKIHQVLVTSPAPLPKARTGAALLVEMADDARLDDRKLGADRHDEVLNAEARDGAVPRRNDGR